jgi:hypothetical protein
MGQLTHIGWLMGHDNFCAKMKRATNMRKHIILIRKAGLTCIDVIQTTHIDIRHKKHIIHNKIRTRAVTTQFEAIPVRKLTIAGRSLQLDILQLHASPSIYPICHAIVAGKQLQVQVPPIVVQTPAPKQSLLRSLVFDPEMVPAFHEPIAVSSIHSLEVRN